jgi:hypothetical protein
MVLPHGPDNEISLFRFTATHNYRIIIDLHLIIYPIPTRLHYFSDQTRISHRCIIGSEFWAACRLAMHERTAQEQPKFYDLLSLDDQELYNQLRSTFSSEFHRNRRGRRLADFRDMISSIRAFCIRNREDDWKRCLVCGVCWLPNGIAFNNRQLCVLSDKCKSSINGVLHQLGYSSTQSKLESHESLGEAMPILKNSFNELVEWTVRPFNTPVQVTRVSFPQDPGQPMGIPMLSEPPRFRQELPGLCGRQHQPMVQKGEGRIRFPMLEPFSRRGEWKWRGRRANTVTKLNQA